MKVAVYARVSTDSQELEQQIAACKRFCEARGFEIAKVFAEIGSGKSFSRPEFQDMRSAARQREFEGIVVFRFDRIGRNAREVVVFFEETENLGVKIFSICEGFDTTTAIGRAMREILLILAQLEREQLSEATKHRLNALRNLGKHLGRPQKEFDLAKAEELRSQGVSWRKIAMSLKVPQATIRGRLQIRRAEKDAVKTDENSSGNGGRADFAVSRTGGEVS